MIELATATPQGLLQQRVCKPPQASPLSEQNPTTQAAARKGTVVPAQAPLPVQARRITAFGSRS